MRQTPAPEAGPRRGSAAARVFTLFAPVLASLLFLAGASGHDAGQGRYYIDGMGNTATLGALVYWAAQLVSVLAYLGTRGFSRSVQEAAGRVFPLLMIVNGFLVVFAVQAAVGDARAGVGDMAFAHAWSAVPLLVSIVWLARTGRGNTADAAQP